MGGPSGTVTFMFTDIEGSTRLWEAAPEAMRGALPRHDELVRSAIESHGGFVFATGGDGFAAAFGRAADALAAAGAVQAALAGEAWPDAAPIVVRIGLHTGEVDERDGNYFGPAVNRAARVMGAGHGGQVLVSAATAAVAGRVGLVDLGEHAFAGLATPERVFQLGGATFAPLRAVGAVATNLPGERTAFVGRDRELGVVAGLVRSARLVTLTGVGGVGKTRLAVRTATGMVDEFPGGVWLVELAPLIDAALVATTVASAVGAPVASGLASSEVVCRFLAYRRGLVVLDNCEHVIDAAAALVDRLLGAAPRVRVLATSREPLDVAGESTWRVPSLSLDGDGGVGDAVVLFAERAAQVQPGFGLADPSTREAAVAVCRRLDGIPLAIELAAARARVLSVDQIAAHLDERFRLLTGGGRTAVARQHTLQGAIDWSYALLTVPERAVFDTLGVFAGEFDLAAVAAVGHLDEFAALDLLESLVDKSMVEADPTRNRYRLLETLRHYARDRLVVAGRLGEVRDAHAAWFATVAGEQAKQMGQAGHPLDALDRLEADYDNLRAALAWLIEQHQAEAAARMVRRLSGLFNIRHPREGFGWFQQVVTIAGDLPATARARLLGDTAHAAMNAGDRDADTRYAQAAIEAGGDDAPAVAHWLLGNSAYKAGDHPGAIARYRRAIAAAAASGDLTSQTTATAMLAVTTAELHHHAEARRLIPDAIELAERLGHPTILAAAHEIAAEALSVIGAQRESAAMFERGLVHIDAAGPIMGCVYRGSFALRADDPHQAARILGVAIPIAKHHLGGYYQAIPLIAAAKIAAATGHDPTAATLLGAFEHHGGRTVLTVNVGQQCEHLASQLADRLGAAVVEDQLDRGARLTIAQALQLADDIVAATS